MGNYEPSENTRGDWWKNKLEQLRKKSFYRAIRKEILINLNCTIFVRNILRYDK